MIPKDTSEITIGQIAKRTGLAVSAIRFYEEKALLVSRRTRAGQRRFRRSDIRRLSFIQIAQQLGFTLEEIKFQLQKLPDNRTPNKQDWQKLSRGFRSHLETRIDGLIKLRDTLDGCIGCGCLSLKICKLYNPEDRAAKSGTGARYLLGDAPPV